MSDLRPEPSAAAIGESVEEAALRVLADAPKADLSRLRLTDTEIVRGLAKCALTVLVERGEVHQARDAAERRVAELERQRETLREALEKYGAHRMGCEGQQVVSKSQPWPETHTWEHAGKLCNCGLDQIRAALRGAAQEAPKS
jgi:hypothetical protein